MSRLFWNAVKASPFVFGTFFLLLNNASASTSEETIFESAVVTPIEKSTESLSVADLSNKMLLKQVADSESSLSFNSQLVDNTLPRTTPAKNL